MRLLKYPGKILLMLALFLAPLGTALSQYAHPPGAEQNMEEYSKLAGAVVFLLVAFLFILFFVLSTPKYKYSYERKAKKVSAFKKFRQRITQAVPVEAEQDIVLDHDFDGIRELDNKIPPWYNFLFYGTIVFAIIYFLSFHVFGVGKLMTDEYADEIRIAQQQRDELIKTGAFVNENTVTLLTDAASLENGKSTFMNNCIPCHGPNGGGIVGPNLTDDYWIHGGGIKNIFTTIKYGVPVKGMISWQTQMNPKKMQEVASFVISLHGTKPENGKPPEGQLWVDSSQTKPLGDSLKTSLKKTDSTKVDTTKKVTK